jgi:hypothetical protein
VRNFLERLFPARQRKSETFDNVERLKKLVGVTDVNPVWQASLDVIQERLEIEFNVVLDTTRSDTEKLRACEGLRVTWMLLTTLEQEREHADEWRKLPENNPSKT